MMKAVQQKIISPKPSLQKNVNSNIYNYLLYTPHNFHSRKWPLIIFLHGAGEMAKVPNSLEKVKKNGIPKIVEDLPHTEERDKIFPFIAVSPQAGLPRKYGWDPALIKNLLEDVIKEHKDYIDLNRLYLTGISMGGYGTWATAAAYPTLFAAILPICGGCDPDAAPFLKDIPIWNFHGKKDDIVPISESEVIIKALKKQGAKDLNYTIYPDAEHDSWTVTYENPEIYKWFLKYEKVNKTD